MALAPRLTTLGTNRRFGASADGTGERYVVMFDLRGGSGEEGLLRTVWVSERVPQVSDTEIAARPLTDAGSLNAKGAQQWSS
jgi:hypothetical protein